MYGFKDNYGKQYAFIAPAFKYGGDIYDYKTEDGDVTLETIEDITDGFYLLQLPSIFINRDNDIPSGDPRKTTVSIIKSDGEVLNSVTVYCPYTDRFGNDTYTFPVIPFCIEEDLIDNIQITISSNHDSPKIWMGGNEIEFKLFEI